MKKLSTFLRYFFLTLGVAFSVLILLVAIILMMPEKIFSPERVGKFFTDQEGAELSWKSARWTFPWRGGASRGFRGRIEDLCFSGKNSSVKYSTCIEVAEWDLNFSLSGAGIKINQPKPVLVRSSELRLEIFKTADESLQKEDSAPFDLESQLQKFFRIPLPDLDLQIHSLRVMNGPTGDLDMKLQATVSDGSLDLRLTPRKKIASMSFPPLRLLVNDAKARLEFLRQPKITLGGKSVRIRDFTFFVNLSEKNLEARLDARAEGMRLRAVSQLTRPLVWSNGLLGFKEDLLNHSRIDLDIPGGPQALQHYFPKPFTELPAPLNTLRGRVRLFVWGESQLSGELRDPQLRSRLEIDLKGPQQEVVLLAEATAHMDLEKFRPRSVRASIDFKKMRLVLPRFDYRERPPRLTSDPRFVKDDQALEIQQEAIADAVPWTLHLGASNPDSLTFVSNLVDQPLRWNADLLIKDGGVQEGQVNLLPMRILLLRRPISVEQLEVEWPEDSVARLRAQFEFKLPEHRIRMKVEGLLREPQYVFESTPPLSQEDIMAVLLFGRPLEELDPDSHDSLAQSRQIISRGLFSIGSLYIFSGTPIQSVGYDPQSQMLSARVRVSGRDSLRIKAGESGVGSLALRRSLGSGWYIDTSVQQTANDESLKDFGLLLERVIAY